MLNGASYSDSFSTMFRIARGSMLSEQLPDRDVKGEDPLPKYLARAQVSVVEKNSSMDERVGYEML